MLLSGNLITGSQFYRSRTKKYEYVTCFIEVEIGDVHFQSMVLVFSVSSEVKNIYVKRVLALREQEGN
jgi:hypothetical protein